MRSQKSSKNKTRSIRATVAQPLISGFLPTAKLNSAGRIYRGRFTCPSVQWTGEPPDSLATFTVTAEELADAAESGLLWTDQDVQRGIRPGLAKKPAQELSLAAGYPPAEFYVFDSVNADDIVEKLLHGQRLFLSPLVWNLRPGAFEAYWHQDEESIYVYSGKIYLPDSHHRQQALLKAVRLWRDSPTSFPKFSGARQFKLELYFLSREGEGDYFYDKNQLTKPTAKSKAYDLTTRDDLSLLAKKVIEKSESLKDNVNRITDRLTAKNPQVVTLSTLREMMKALAPDGYVDSHELEGLASIGARFYDSLASVRPELGHLLPGERRAVRNRLLVDAAVMMQGYAGLLREYSNELAKLGTQRAIATWERKLERLSSSHAYRFADWSGDLFEKHNPLWQRVGVVKPSRDGRKLTVLNTGAARAECGRVLRQILFLDQDIEDLGFVAER